MGAPAPIATHTIHAGLSKEGTRVVLHDHPHTQCPRSALRGPGTSVSYECTQYGVRVSSLIFTTAVTPNPTPWGNRGAGPLEIEVRAMAMPTFTVVKTSQVGNHSFQVVLFTTEHIHIRSVFRYIQQYEQPARRRCVALQLRVKLQQQRCIEKLLYAAMADSSGFVPNQQQPQLIQLLYRLHRPRANK